MRPRVGAWVLALSAGLVLLAPAGVQGQTRRADRESIAIEIAKWTTGALATTAGALAFLIHDDAQERYEGIEAVCEASPTACFVDVPGSAYADPALEARYQDVRDDFRTSRLLLVGAHVLAIGTVVLFILDMPTDVTPDNVPYEPPSLRFGVRADGALEASFRYPVSNILTRSP